MTLIQTSPQPKGLAGALNMTIPMDDLKIALSINQVPGRNPYSKASWEKIAWPSMKSLSDWYGDMLLRCEQLDQWTEKLIMPHSMWMPALFNPTVICRPP